MACVEIAVIFDRRGIKQAAAFGPNQLTLSSGADWSTSSVTCTGNFNSVLLE